MLSASGRTDDGRDDEMIYMMTRAAGGGTILGGCYQKDNWDPLPDLNLAVRIMDRAVQLCPRLVTGNDGVGKGVSGLDIIRHGVGLRPLRDGGPRIEREELNVDGGVSTIVHNYGHGGYGYQSSYGCAGTAVNLVKEAALEKEKTYSKSKL